MRHASVFFALALVTLAAPTAACAQSSRAARVLTLLSGDSPAVLIRSDRVYAPADMQALSVCAGSRCAPVVSSQACSVPECPGNGVRYQLAASIADVSDYPTDRDGFNRANDMLRSDPALAGIAWSFGVHPSAPPLPPEDNIWLTPRRLRNTAWELGATAIGGVLGVSGVGFVGGEVAGGFRYTWDASGDDDEFLAILFGNIVGLDVRVRTFDLMPVQGPSGWGVTVGIAPGTGYAPRRESFRLPSVYSWMLPEIGVALRQGFDAAAYFGWSLPINVLLNDQFGIEARFSVLVIDDWIPGDDVEALVSFGLGLITR